MPWTTRNGARFSSWLGAFGLHLAVVIALPSAPETPPSRPLVATFELSPPVAAEPPVAAPVPITPPAPIAAARPSVSHPRRQAASRRRSKPRPRPVAPAPADTSPAVTSPAVTSPAAQVASAPVLATPVLAAHTGEAAHTEPAAGPPATSTGQAARQAGSGDAATGGPGTGAPTAGGAPLRRPGLIAFGDPCAGYFPAGAAGERGVVQVVVRVDAHGHARAERVLLEAPRDEGFAAAARACAARLRFTPALDARGVAVPGQAKLELHFRRDHAPA